MAMRAKKIQPVKADAIDDLKSKIGASKDFIFTEYRGLTVEQISTLRKQLRAKNAEFHVVKNNFARIAFEELGYPKDVEPVLAGPDRRRLRQGRFQRGRQDPRRFRQGSPGAQGQGRPRRQGLHGRQARSRPSPSSPAGTQLIAMFMAGLKSPVQKLVYTLVALQEKLGAGAPAAAARRGRGRRGGCRAEPRLPPPRRRPQA